MAEGDIGAVIDSLEFDPDDFWEGSVITINAGVVAVAYSGVGFDGWIRTFAVDSAGNIGDSEIDHLEFDASTGHWPSICHVQDDIYAIAYTSATNQGKLVTVSIDSAGNISNAVLDSWIYESTQGTYNSTIKITDGIIAVANSETGDIGNVFTCAISDAGVITKSRIDELDFAGATITAKQIIHGRGTKYAIVYTGPGNDGFICSLDIANDGTISNTVIDSLEFAVSDGTYPRVAVIGEGILAIVSRDYWADGWLYTISIDADGNISDAVLDSWEFDPVSGSYPDIVKVSDTVATIVWSDAANHGQALSVTISDAGVITKTAIDTLEFESTAGTYCRLVHLASNIYAVAYQGPDADGWAKTFDIESPITEVPHHELCMGMGP